MTGFDNPDNLAQGPDGRRWVCEDNDYSDVYVADGDKNKDGVADGVHLFASRTVTRIRTQGRRRRVSVRLAQGRRRKEHRHLLRQGPEGLFVNVQHPDKPLADGTWKITHRHDDESLFVQSPGSGGMSRSPTRFVCVAATARDVVASTPWPDCSIDSHTSRSRSTPLR